MMKPGDLACFPREMWVYRDVALDEGEGAGSCWLSEPGGLVLVLACPDRAEGRVVSVLDCHGRIGLVFLVDLQVA